MKKLLSTLIYWLNYFFVNIMKQDGMKHLIVGILLTSVLKFLLPFALMLAMISAILIIKELVCEDEMEEKYPEMRDFLWGFGGVVLGMV